MALIQAVQTLCTKDFLAINQIMHRPLAVADKLPSFFQSVLTGYLVLDCCNPLCSPTACGQVFASVTALL